MYRCACLAFLGTNQQYINLHRNIHGFCQESIGPAPGVLRFSCCYVLFYLSASSNVHRGREEPLEGQLIGRLLIRFLVWTIPNDHHRLVRNAYVMSHVFRTGPEFHDPIAHFSENWGLVALSPMIGGNLFSMAFGKNLDGHSSDDSNLPPTTSPDTTIHALCMEGLECYIWSLRLTTWACVLAFGLAVWAGYKDWKKSKEEEKGGGYRPVFDNDS